ncbi:hypothetical protein [Legionella hackeliae]|uniref:Uncharacterized protein n=1 Tax=Legionella hackeliae TaxID=449 RepID=A0A0A8ULH0_LEGHA|nr:hypothetical protein [Legionella hackeliae]KTD10080.1 hypothetical protein Lhac_2448 [Legionella hackeliae]CEK09568.1 protein of unknown function [Legionella hackeliae]STX49478.1 Uncharacterised protein [Legionella hackeliae]
MRQKNETEKEVKKKFVTSIRPSLFRAEKNSEKDSFENFLKEHADKSINAKFLLGRTKFYNLEAFEGRFIKDLPLLKEIITAEVNRSEGTFVFYNGSSSAVKFFRMVTSVIHRLDDLHTDKERAKTNMVIGCLKKKSFPPQRFFDKTLDRMKSYHPFNSNYFASAIKEFDHEDNIRKHLLCASILLHDGYFGETSWLLFQKNKSMSVMNEENFLGTVLDELCKKKKLEHFPIEELVKLYSSYKQILQAQLLQIFINQNAFNDLGYYCYAGGTPLAADSAAFLSELFVQLASQNSDNWQSALKEKFVQGFKENKLHPLVDSDPSSNLTEEWLCALQVRFVATNPDFYNSEAVTINEFYRTDEAYHTTKRLKKELETLISSYFAEKADEQTIQPL